MDLNANPFSTISPYRALGANRRKRLVLGVCKRSTFYSIGLLALTGIFLFFAFSVQLLIAVLLFAGILPVVYITRRYALNDNPEKGSYIFISYLLIVVFVNSLLVDGFHLFLVPGYMVLVLTSGMMLTPVQSFQVAGAASFLFLLSQVLLSYDLNRIQLPGVMVEYVTMGLVILSYVVVALTMELSTRDLRRAVDEATHHLMISNERLEKASEMKSQFTARTSHELRTPLSSIIVFTDLALREAYGPIDESLRRSLELVVSSARKLKTIINNILDLSKIEAGECVMDLCPIEVHKIARETISKFVSQSQSKDLHLELSIAERMPNEMIGDGERLEQILSNLVSNAIKFTDSGSVKVSLDVHDEHYWQITVNDTGNGIPHDYLIHIFKPYFQLEAVPGALRSTGLGLAITKNLVELMGGKILVESKLGQGTQFTVILPLLTSTSGIVETWPSLAYE